MVQVAHGNNSIGTTIDAKKLKLLTNLFNNDMKVKITRVVLVMEDGSKTTIKPNKIVEDVEAYRKLVKETNNASVVLFNTEEIG